MPVRVHLDRLLECRVDVAALENVERFHVRGIDLGFVDALRLCVERAERGELALDRRFDDLLAGHYRLQPAAHCFDFW